MKTLALRPRFTLDVAAASGLVVMGDVACVVSDDGLRLHRYRLGDGAALAPFALAAGAPAGAIAKKDKPDLEALLDAGDGALLALGSGSRPNRERGFRLEPATGVARTVDLSGLYATLRERVGELNVEGATRFGDALVIAHRRTGRGSSNVLAVLDPAVLTARVWTAAHLRATVTVDLPALDGVPLGLTDLAVHPKSGLHFLAAAEDTDDAYLDGRCTGTVLGRFDPSFGVADLLRLDPGLKFEGLAWHADRWLLVADADDPQARSPLFETTP